MAVVAAGPVVETTLPAAGLTGSQCPRCGVVVHPETAGCPRCGGDMVARALSTGGVLWTWTVQRFAPKSPPYQAPPEGFRPFAVGYVELPEGVRVEAVIEVDDLASVRIGMPLRLIPAVHSGCVPRFAAPDGPVGR